MKTREELIAKAAEDPGFREQLKGDPRGTFAREFGTTIPDDFEITVVEETPKHAYIVLPVSSSDLSPEDLAAASGGVDVVAYTNLICTPTLMGAPGCGVS